MYKVYKEDCSPCRTLSKLMKMINIPEDIEVISVDAKDEKNKEFIQKHEIKITPTLVFETGLKMEGVKRKEVINNFINGRGEINL